MQDQVSYRLLQEKNWRQPLNSTEQAAVEGMLAGNPDAQSDWQAEVALTQVLTGLRDVPVSSNFTARVLHAAEHKAADDRRQRVSGWLRDYGVRYWLPRTALAAVVVVAGIFSWMRIENEQQNRVTLVKSVATISQAAALADPEILRDFDAIMVMKQQPMADEELLRVMQ